jgi:hypothetical protein
MVLFFLAYLALTDPFAFQKEASARDLILQLGEAYVRPEYQHFTKTAICNFDPASVANTISGMGGRPFTAVVCTFQTPCSAEVLRQVWHEPFIGAYTSAEPLSWNIAETCSEMLTDEALAEVQANMQQGG